MNTVVPAEIEIDEMSVKALVSAQFGLQVARIAKLGEGFDNIIFLINDEWAFRFPRRKIAVALIEHELAVLPRLAGNLSVEIPTPVFISTPSAEFAYPFYGYRLLDGQSGCSVSFSAQDYSRAASDLGAFVRELHNIDTSHFAGALTPVFDRLNFTQLERYFSQRLAHVKEPYQLHTYDQKMKSILSDAESFVPENSHCFVHGDLYHRHVLFNGNKKLSGVIDWGDSCLANPVVDLGIVFQFLPKNTHHHFFEAYGEVNDHALAYARFLGLYYSIALLWYGNDRGDQDLIRTSLWTIEEL